MTPEIQKIAGIAAYNERERRRSDRQRRHPATFAIVDRETGNWWRGEFPERLWVSRKKQRATMTRVHAMHLRSKLGRYAHVVNTARYASKR